MLKGGDVVTLGFLTLAGIHAIPAFPAVVPGQLGRLYGIDEGDKGLVLLLRHRALLFGVLAVACVAAAFDPDLQPLVLAAAVVSMAGYLGLYLIAGSPAGPLRNVATVDGIGLAAAVATWLAG